MVETKVLSVLGLTSDDSLFLCVYVTVSYSSLEGCDVVEIKMQNDMIKPAVKGVTNVLCACIRAKSIKQVVMISSTAAVLINT